MTSRERALVNLIRWALGEGGEFPMLPDDWPKRKFYWREELRRRFEAINRAPKNRQRRVAQDRKP